MQQLEGRMDGRMQEMETRMGARMQEMETRIVDRLTEFTRDTENLWAAAAKRRTKDGG